MQKTIKILLLCLSFTPFIYDSSVFFPDSAGKIFFARLILTVVSILFLLSFVFLKNFRDEIIRKISIYIKHPIVLSVAAFIFIFILSAIFAVDKYTAFWGDIQRGEGLVGMIYFFSLFVFSLLVFERKDWLWFFKFSLLASIVLLGKEFWDFFQGVERSGSFVGNPTFLAGYLLFSIFASILVFREVGNKLWKYLSLLVFTMSFLGIFITETRGAILGLLLGFVTVLIYGIFKGKEVFYRNLNFQKISVIFLLLLVVFSAVFFTTKNIEFWQKVPGLARVATISTEDISTRTRLFSIESSLTSVNPSPNSLKEFLIGWGPNNFILAFGKYYHVEQYKYEVEWFDRAHNKILDVLIMNGVLGLLAYLSIWFFYFKTIFKNKNFSLENIGLIFFGTAFFVHLLFVFDNIVTSIPFFLILGFLVSLHTEEIREVILATKWQKNIFTMFFIFLVFGVGFTFLRGDLISYFQMRKYFSYKRSGEMILPSISIFEPFTIAQSNIRGDFFRNSVIALQPSSDILKMSFKRADEYIEKMPEDFRFEAAAAGSYTRYGNKINDPLIMAKGEEYLREALTFVPNRPDFIYGLALNLAYQKRYDEAFEVLDEVIKADDKLADSYYYFGYLLLLPDKKDYNKSFDNIEKSFNMKSDLFLKNKIEMASIYGNFVKYFYNTKDKERFTQAANRLINNSHTQSTALNSMLLFMEERGVWPQVEFK